MPEIIYDVQLREKDGANNFDIVYHPITKVVNVEGLVDVNNKLNLNLFPDWMFSTKRNAGALNGDISFENVLEVIKDRLNITDESLLNGAYVTVNKSDGLIIAPSTNHKAVNSDDGAMNASTLTLEVNDTLTYIGQHVEYTGDPVRGTTVFNFVLTDYADWQQALSNGPQSQMEITLSGITGVPTPTEVKTQVEIVYTTLNSLNAYYDRWDTAQGFVIVKVNVDFGTEYFRLTPNLPPTMVHYWSVTNNTYPLATMSTAGLMSSALVTKLNGISVGANNYSHPPYTERSIDTDGIEVINIISSDATGHVTGASKRTLPNATQSLPGVMSAADKTKLDGLSNYSHYTQAAIDVNATDNGINVIDRITVNTQGHVTFVGSRNLSSATTSASGVVELATTTESTTGTDTTRASTPSGVKAAIDYFAGLKVYSDLTAANTSQANHAVGSIVLVKV